MVAMELNFAYFAAGPLRDLIENVRPVRNVLELTLNLYIKKALGLEVRNEILLPFMHQVRVHGILLVHRNQLLLRTATYPRSHHLDFNPWSLNDVECDIRTIGLRVVNSRSQLDPRGQVVLLSQLALKKRDRVFIATQRIRLACLETGVFDTRTEGIQAAGQAFCLSFWDAGNENLPVLGMTPKFDEKADVH